MAAGETARSKSKGSSRAARKALVAVALGGVAIGGASAADIVGTSESGEEAAGENDVVQVLDGSTIGTFGSIGITAALDDAYIKVRGSTASTASGVNSVAIGNGAVAGGAGDPNSISTQIAIGSSANAQGLSSISVGSASKADGQGATALGRLSAAQAARATALGDNATATADGAVALGSGSVANRGNAVSVGSAAVQRQITNVAAGTQGTDAVNVTQLNAAIANVGVNSPYFKANGAGDGTDNAVATGFGSIAVGSKATASAANGVAIGNTAIASTDSVAIGHGASAPNSNGVSIGTNSSADQNGASLGYNARASQNAVALGANSVAIGSNSVALGNGSIATVANTVSVGSAGKERKIVNVAAGTLSSTSTDTVNGSQLFATNTRVGSLEDSLNGGGVIDPTTGESLAVVYDSTAKDKVTLGGTGASTPVELKNVAAGKDDTDAVNVGQLKDSGLIGDDGSGNLTSLAVTYDDATKAGITLGGTGATTPVAIHNVADGVLSATSKDAVNGSQLFATNTRVGSLEDSLKGGGVIDPTTGESLAVVYDSATKDQITLGGASGTKLTNVAAGAVNATSSDAINGSQLYGTANSVATALGGSSTVGADGGVTTPTYSLTDPAGGTDKVDYHNVGDALTNLDGRVATNTGDIADLRDALKDGGVIDPTTGESLAVTYDSTAKDSLTLGSAGTPVAVHNVADGLLSATSNDAVNGSQLFATNTRVGSLEDSLKDSGLVGDDGKAIAAVVYDSETKDKVTLGGGADGTTLANVKAGVADTDAVNVSQLKGSGLIGDDGKAIAAVVYDSAAKDKVTLGGTGATTPVQVKNVANATDANDAVNLSQLNKAVADAGVSNPYIGGRGTGTAAQSTALNAVALGLGSVANQINTISVGNSATGLTRRITNVADGNAASDAATVGQVSDLVGGVSTRTQSAIDDVNFKVAALDSRLSTNAVVGTDPYVKVDGQGDGSDSASVPVGSYGVAIGADANASGTTGIAIGAAATSTNTSSIALGTGANATANNAMAFGANSNATGTGATALGNGTNATGNYAVALGLNANAAGTNGLAIGNTSNAAAADSIALGTLSNVASAATNSLALGRAAQVQAAATNSVALGAGSVANRINSISVGNVGAERQITNVATGTAGTDAVNVDQLKKYVADNAGDGGNPLAVAYDDDTKGTVTLAGTGGTKLTNVAAGAVNATSTDAINGSQLYGTANSVATALGGGSTVGANGNVTAPTYSLTDPAGGADKVDYHNVGDALTNLDGRVATNTGDLADLRDALHDGGVIDPTTGESLAVVYDSTAKDSVTLGSAGTPVAIHNVADGVLSATSKDAVNGSQLFATNTRVGSLEDSLHDGGVIDPTTGQSLAVVYDSVAKDKVTLGGTGASTPVELKNVAAGKDDTDAVNVGQLKDSGLIDDDGSGNLTSLAVTYDDATKAGVTLGGTGATTPVAIHNVANGVLSATSKDAVNGSQLYATNQDIGDLRDSLRDGGVIDPTTGESLAVVYDSVAKNSVTLGGTGASTPVQLKNVAAATEDTDAVNLAQLKDAGLVAPADPSNPGTGLASLAVTYGTKADGSANFDEVKLKGANGTTITNVKAGVADLDAVNVGQLKDSGLIGDDGSGNLTSLAVTYDDATKAGITLGGTGATTPVAIHNVADGVLSATSKDAVNGSQLYATNQDIGDLRDSLHDGGVIDPTTGQSLAVVYDSVAKDKVTLGGTGASTPVVLSNVAEGVAGTDAVNVDQLTAALKDLDTGLNPLAVSYDSAAKSSVTLGGTGASTPVELKNVAAGKDDTDAVNVGQLKDSGLIGDDGSGNLTSLAVTYDDATKAGITLGGTGATTPVAIHNVADGVLSATSKDAVNGSQLFATNTRVGSLEDSLHDGGVIDPTTGQSLAVVYDSVAKNSVTLGGTGASSPVQLKNVAAGTEDTDAVNVAQLKDAGLVAPVDPSNPGSGLASLAVTYGTKADGSANFDEVKLKGTNGTTITNVKAGVADLDAVNVGQLKDSGLIGDDGSGNLTSLAVTYDDATKAGITLGGTGATTPVAIHNVADGALSATSKDAVNGSQLYATNQSIGDLRDSLRDGGVIDPTTGDSLAVVYDSVAKDKVTLGGTGASSPVQLKNVAAGTDDTDAVNVAQLKDAGLVAPVDPSNPGTGLASLAVTYGTKADGSANFDEVKLKGTSGTKLTNVAAGAVNATSTDAINGSQLYGTANSVATALGGGSTVDASGNVTAPTYSLTDPAGGSGKVDYHNVGDALTNLDGRVATNTGDLADLRDALHDGGVIDPTTGESLAVVYDSTAKDKVTLGGTGATTAVQLKNVAAGTDDTDAVNVAQLKDAGLVGDDDKGNLMSLAVTYDDATKAGITLGGTGATTPVAIHNLADGALSATSKDAVNGSQLFATNTRVGSLEESLRDGGVIDPTTGQSLAVVYDSATKNSVTLGGVGAAAPVQLKNVAAGTDDTDAVNVAQLKDAGLVAPVDPSNPGTGLASLAVTYGTNADGSANFDEVTLKGTSGTTITNVAAGAVNATSTDAINGSQLYGTAQSVADTIGGGTTVGADGTLANTAIEVHGQKYSTVAEAVQAAAAYGATDSLAVRYDLNGDGTPNFGSVTLGGSGAAPVRLTNVADGTSQYDAVNYGQLSALNDKIGNLDDRVGGLELQPGNPGGGGGGSGDSPYFGATDQTADGSSAANPGTGTGNVAAGSGSSIGTGVNNGTVIGSGSTVGSSGGTAIGSGSAAKGENATAIGQGSSATGSGSVAIGSGSVATEANTVSFGDGTDTGNRRIVNIADGIGANDAATKGQLDRAVGGLAGQINDVSKNAYSGIAAATALTMIPGVDPGKTLSFGVGGATYKGYQAVAFGGEARITQNLKMKAGVGLSSGGNTVGVGASYQW
ncbi:YadA-like family protein [Burkholderia sp. BCC0405]|uniref:YadA-like family protein n=1 Tax=Burkholderia sp. BCC0405 TaxID=2676298 RepID=UPI001FC8D723|nr:YadA-like family protein [Burkholderia sp. BCC0405]